MRLEIITAERALFDGEVDVIVAPSGDGEIAILPHHAPVMTTLVPGELRYGISGENHYYVVHGGFMEIRSDQVIVLADGAERLDEVNEVRAREAVERANERMSGEGEEIDLERALSSLRRAQLRLGVVSRRRRNRASGESNETR